MTETAKPWKRWFKEAMTWAIFILSILAVRSSLASTYVVPSESMEPTILPGDRLFADQRAYGWRLPFSTKPLSKHLPPQRGDIAIFPSPAEPNITLIKRVVAIGGDTIAVKQGQIILNGKPIIQKMIEQKGNVRLYQAVLGEHRFRVRLDDQHASARDMPTRRVPKGFFFVMGDNRDFSGDSRFFGPVSIKKLRARAMRLFFSIDQQKGFPHFRWGRTGGALR